MKKTNAGALIAAAKAKAAGSKATPPAALRAELIKIVKHNLASPKSEHVTHADMASLCETHGVKVGRDVLRRWLRELESELGK